jgi:hypothetical protein
MNHIYIHALLLCIFTELFYMLVITMQGANCSSRSYVHVLVYLHTVHGNGNGRTAHAHVYPYHALYDYHALPRLIGPFSLIRSYIDERSFPWLK